MEFDWDDHNTKRLRSHRVSRHEFEEVLRGDPDLEYQTEDGEVPYRALGTTQRGRILIVVWTPRDGRVRAIIAYNAGSLYQKLSRKIRT